ncbi:MAG: autotransporter-associated beta strand repeat-containing protein [Kiritimatiellae bacterium]|nr:autotransporter-associated beta strand repeat-containing protein [Kiritimatiellia bacterium]
MKQLLATLAAPLFAASGALFAQDVVYSIWNPNGTGSWSDAARWVDGRVPQTGGNVLIDGADAWIADADYALLKSLTRLRFSGDASLDMRFDEDHGDFAVNTVMGNTGNAEGTLVKSGTGLLVHTGVGNGFKIDKFIVTNGTLRIDYAVGSTVSGGQIAQNVFGAYGRGVLLFNNPTVPKINGLVGDGTVSNALSSMQFEFTGGTREAPMVFSGTLGKNIQATFRSGCQYFTKPERTGVSTVTRIFGGHAGFSKFGEASGDAGSLGTQDYIARFQGEGGGIVYLGHGETTSKKIWFDSGARSATLDAGPHGGIIFTGVFDGSGCGRVIPLALDGGNVAGAAIQGTFVGASTTTFPIVKKGPGIWRFSGARDCIGSVTVEEGTLEYASMANAETVCSLGKAERLTLPEAKTYADSTLVPWAFSLGTHSTTGALVYVGTDDFSCTTRSFAISGSGVVGSGIANAAIHFAGAASRDSDGPNTLILDGDGMWNNFTDVTNGVGVLAVEKRGSGTWTLGGDVLLSGGIAVKGGTLRIANGPYRYYRFTVKQLHDGNDRYLQLKQFRLSAADGAQCNADLVESAETKGKDFRIAPGECIWNHAVSFSDGSRVLANLFKSAGMVSAQRSGTTTRPTPSDSSTWVSFTFRVADDAEPAAYYDIMTQTGGHNNREPRDWVLEASADGRNWDVVDTRTGMGVSASGQRWYSSGGTEFDAAHPGYAIASAPAGVTTEIGSVAIEGGTLVAGAPVPVSHLMVDAAQTGAASGLALEQDGILEIVNAPADASEFVVPVSLAGSVNSTNLKRWKLRIDGVETAARTVSVTSSGIRVGPGGTVILVQ